MQEGQNPRDIEEKLKAYLLQDEQVQFEISQPMIFGQLEKQEG